MLVKTTFMRLGLARTRRKKTINKIATDFADTRLNRHRGQFNENGKGRGHYTQRFMNIADIRLNRPWGHIAYFRSCL